MALGSIEKISETFLYIFKKEECTWAAIFAFCLSSIVELQTSTNFIKPHKGLLISGHPIQKSVGIGIGTITKKLFICYGSTERNLMNIKREISHIDVIVVNCGTPIAGTEVKVVDAS